MHHLESRQCNSYVCVCVFCQLGGPLLNFMFEALRGSAIYCHLTAIRAYVIYDPIEKDQMYLYENVVRYIAI